MQGNKEVGDDLYLSEVGRGEGEQKEWSGNPGRVWFCSGTHKGMVIAAT